MAKRRCSVAVSVALIAIASAGCDQATSTASQTSKPTIALASALPDDPASLEASADEASLTDKQASDPPPKLDLPADPNATVEATFDHLKFDIEPDAKFDEAMLTPTIHKLFDRNIRIRGYIYPTLKKRGIKQFILVRDNQECCFGPGAALFDCILVHMQEGKTAEYSIRPVAVEGKFSYEVFPDYDGTTRAIYRLDGESVE